MSLLVEQARIARHAAQKRQRELALLERTAGYQGKPLKLVMGIPKHCFENAMEAVFARPDRLVYVEGFYIHDYKDGDVVLTHHGWVLDKVTGTRHEVTLRDVDKDAVYIGKEFTRAELKGFEDGEPLDYTENWTHQLSMQDQFDLLTAAGYDVQLTAEHWLNYGMPDEEWDDLSVVDLSTIDMSLPAEHAQYALVKERGEGWVYRWEVKGDSEEEPPLCQSAA